MVVYRCLANKIPYIKTNSVRFYDQHCPVLLQPFNKLVGKGLTTENLFQFPLLLQCLAVAVLTGVLAGFYPALILSALQPSLVLRGILLRSGRRVYLRRVLVVLQFAVSVALIVGTAVIYKQVNFLHGMDLGFESRNLLYIPLSGELREHAETAKLELLAMMPPKADSGSVR